MPVIEQLTPAALKEILDKNVAVVLLDVRDASEFDFCHIENSASIPMPEVPARQNQLDSSAFTVVICHHGVRSLQVARYLAGNGFSKIANLEGGIDAWAREIESDMPVY